MESNSRSDLSLQARAAMLRRAASRRRTVNVNRTPNAPLAGSMETARDALEVAWDSTQEIRPEQAANVSPATVPDKPSQGRGGTSDVKRYGEHVRLHRGKWRVRNDAWSRARSPEVGAAKVAEIVAERYRVNVRAETVTGIGSGGFVRVWTAPGIRPEWKDRNVSDFGPSTDRAEDATLWAERWGVLGGMAYRFEFNRETGEQRRP